MEKPHMQSYLFIGGSQDGLNIPVTPDVDAVQLSAGVGAEKDSYIAETLTVGDAAIIVYRHDSLTSEQVLIRAAHTPNRLPLPRGCVSEQNPTGVPERADEHRHLTRQRSNRSP